MESSPFTSEESQKIQQLRSACSAELNREQSDDHFLIRWLRARNLDVDRAAEMLKKSLKWRKESGADGIVDREEIPLKYRKIYPIGFLGRDCDDNLVSLIPLGRYNHRILLENEGMDRALRFNIIWMERQLRFVKQAETETGRKGLRIVEIVDMEGYSYKELTYGPGREFIMRTNKWMDENYPEMMKTVLVINAPKVFTILFNLIKPFMSRETLSKISIYGSHESQWKSVIRDICSMDQVPVKWGGTKEGKDVFCSQDTSVWIDGPIPVSYFTNDNFTHPGFKSERIGARDMFQLELPIEPASSPSNSDLRWKFKVESYDIGFSISFQGAQSDEPSRLSSESSIIIFPECKVDSKQGWKEGSIPYRGSGVYTITFDNRYSFTRSKTVYYSVQVEDQAVSQAT